MLPSKINWSHLSRLNFNRFIFFRAILSDLYIKRIMGAQQSIYDLQYFKDVPIYCIGFVQDIHFAAQDEETNQTLLKLKAAEPSKMFKYKVKNHKMHKYLYAHAEMISIVKPLRSKGEKIVIISLVKKRGVSIHNIVTILKKQIKIQEKELIYIYQNSQIRNGYDKITDRKKENDKNPPIVELQYSNIQMLG